MKVERICIAGYKNDLRWTQCCVASIRQWYPSIRISLLKDTYRGDYDTCELESAWDVDIFDTEGRVFGWGMIKLEPLLRPTGERIMVIDSDVLFLGPILETLAGFDEDFLVDNHAQPVENIDSFYFNRSFIRAMDPSFVVPDYVFNGGSIVATAGVLNRANFDPFIGYSPDLTIPPRIRDERVFRHSEQGVLNYVVFKQAQEGHLTVRGLEMQIWAGFVSPRSLRIRRLYAEPSYHQLLHFAGPKKTLFTANRNGHLLRYFEAAYYSRLPNGRIRRQRDRLQRMIAVLRKRQPWTQYL